MSGSMGPPCPSCGHIVSMTLDSRPLEGSYRRRKKCSACGQRHTTYEYTREQITVRPSTIASLVRSHEALGAAIRQLEALSDDETVTAEMGDGLWPVGSWLSSALDDPNVCAEMKRDIQQWFDEGGHIRRPTPDLTEVVAVLRLVESDYQTSEKHHPEHVLIPVSTFDRLRTLLARLEGRS